MNDFRNRGYQNTSTKRPDFHRSVKPDDSQVIKNLGGKLFDLKNKTINKDVLNFNQENKISAEECAKELKGIASTQLRKYYNEVVELEKKADQFEFSKVYPSILMLKSQAAYLYGKNKSGNNDKDKPYVYLENFINLLVDTVIESYEKQSVGKECLSAVKLFFEAVVGYHRAYCEKQ